MDEWSRPRELDVFATGDTTVVASDLDQLSRAFGDAVRRGSIAVRDIHARPGHRPGTPIATTSGRRSGPTDIVRPVLVDPRRATAFARDDLFRQPVAGLTLDDRQANTEHQFLVWTGRLSGAHLGAVPVALHLLASPSMVVTVLELVPQGPVRWHQRAFIRAGVDVIEILAIRLVHLGAAATLCSVTDE